MKRFKIVLVLLITSLILSCDTDRDDISRTQAEVNELNLIVRTGEWEITNFTLNNEENTANYSDYFFRFEEANHLTAISQVDEVTGTWRVNSDSGDEYDPYNDVDFHIFFDSSGKLGELANNYDIISASNSEIKLQLAANAIGNTAFLTFRKN